MNHLLFTKIEQFEKCKNRIEKVLFIQHAIEFLIMYYATVFYCHTKAYKLVNRELVDLIQTNFYKRNPLTSHWLKLLQICLTLLGKKIQFSNTSLNKQFQQISLLFMPDSVKKLMKDSPSVKEMCDCISIIRSKGFAHSNSLPVETANIMLSNNFDKIPYYLDSIFGVHNESKLLVADVICSALDDDQQHYSEFYDLSAEIVKSISICKSSEIDFENVYSKNMYCFFEKTNFFIPLAPFLLYRDDLYYFYSGIDNKSLPIYSEIFSNRNICAKLYETAFKDLVQDDLELLSNSDISIKLKLENGIYHNIPAPSFTKFIGRSDSIDKVLKAISNRRIFLVGISGIGGVGKSALIIKMALDFIKQGIKDVSFIIWVSAKKTYLTPEGIEVADQIFSNLSQLFDVILKITGFKAEINLTMQVKRQFVLDVLAIDSFMLIIDNFETVNNPQEFLSFFEEIGDKCANTKVIITTRHQLGSSEKVVDIREFSENEYGEFIDYLFNFKYEYNCSISYEQKRQLYKITGGLPLATEFIVGQVTSENITIDKIITKFTTLKSSHDSILEFSFHESFKLLLENDKKVLYSIALLEKAIMNSICFLSGIDEYDVDDSISKLLKLSFINSNEEGQFSILPLTKVFLNSQLEKEKGINEQLAAKHSEYVFITKISKETSPDNSLSQVIISKDDIALKLAHAAYFLAKQGNFTKSEEYFNQAIAYDSKNGQVWLYWATASRDFTNTIREEYFQKAIQLSSDSERPSIMLDYAKTLSSNNRDKDSIDVLEQIVKECPNNYNAYHLLGKSYYDIARNLKKKNDSRNYQNIQKNLMLSTDSFLKSIYRTPKSHFEQNANAIAFYFLAKISRHNRNSKKAIEYIDMGLELQPHNTRLLEFRDDCERFLQNINNSARYQSQR
jgi:tetratricopeptide (TPR) repeat protein